MLRDGYIYGTTESGQDIYKVPYIYLFYGDFLYNRNTTKSRQQLSKVAISH